MSVFLTDLHRRCIRPDNRLSEPEGSERDRDSRTLCGRYCALARPAIPGERCTLSSWLLRRKFISSCTFLYRRHLFVSADVFRFLEMKKV
jgi:hypothetical protein